MYKDASKPVMSIPHTFLKSLHVCAIQKYLNLIQDLLFSLNTVAMNRQVWEYMRT